MSGIQSSINKLVAGVIGAQEAKFALAQKSMDTEKAEIDRNVAKAWNQTNRVVERLQNLDIEMQKKATNVANRKIQALDTQRKSYKKRLQKKMNRRDM